VLLVLKRIKYNHTGESIADTVILVLKKYELGERLRVFITDNTDLNDTAVAAILKIIRPDLRTTGRRSRYLGYIINLTVKAFLFSNSVEVFKTVTEGVDEISVDLNSEIIKKA
jgi:hypothetical protein